MSNKNKKPYNSSKYNKQKNSTNYNSKNNKNNRNFNEKNNSYKKKDNLDVTTRIRIDEKRINDAESLDVSFLSDKSGKKISNNKKNKILNEKKQILFNFTIIKSIFFVLSFICIIILIMLIVKNNNLNIKKYVEKDVEVEEKIKKEEKIIDDNILFIGDFYTEKLDLDDFDYPYVKISDKSLTTEDLLNDMKDKVYKFNPSVVIIQLGIIDLDNGSKDEQIIERLNDVIYKIKENRPYAKIYIESLYPINKEVDNYEDDILDDDIDNKLIRGINQLIKSLAYENDINYIDVFDLISDDDYNLDEKYTDNGIYLNDNGYKVILDEIRKNVDDKI